MLFKKTRTVYYVNCVSKDKVDKLWLERDGFEHFYAQYKDKVEKETSVCIAVPLVAIAWTGRKLWKIWTSDAMWKIITFAIIFWLLHLIFGPDILRYFNC